MAGFKLVLRLNLLAQVGLVKESFGFGKFDLAEVEMVENGPRARPIVLQSDCEWSLETKKQMRMTHSSSFLVLLGQLHGLLMFSGRIYSCPLT